MDGSSYVRKEFQVAKLYTLDVIAVCVDFVSSKSHYETPSRSDAETYWAILNVWIMHTMQSVKRPRDKMDVQNLETARTYNVNVCVMLVFGAGVVETTPGDANGSWVEQLSRLWNDTSDAIWRHVLLNSYSRDITGVTIDSSKAAVIAVDDDNFAFLIAEAQTPRTMKTSMCANSITKPSNAWDVESVECRGCCAKYCSHLSICSYLAYAIVQAVGKKHNEIAIDGDTVHR